MEEVQLKSEAETTAQTVVAEEKKEGATETEVSLGKFKDVRSLLNAYNSLQAEFTKRCQRIKELEGAKIDKAEAPTIDVENQVGKHEEKAEVSKEQAETTAKTKEEILKEYLSDVLSNKQKAIIMDERGVGVKAPPSKPKTIAEAGNLAKQIL